MIPIRTKLRIDFSDNDAYLEYLTSNNMTYTNVSKTIESVIDNKYKNTVRGLQVGTPGSALINDLSGKYTPFKDTGFDGYISRQLSDSGGSLLASTFVDFYIGGSLLESIHIIFDEASNEYATSFSIRNITRSLQANITNNSPVCTVPLSLVNAYVGDIISLTFITWSKPNSSLKITYIGTGEVFEADGSQLISFTCSENIMNSELSLETGIVEQYANIEIYDKDGYLRKKGLQGMLQKDQYVSLIAIDDNGWSANTEVPLGDYLTEEWQAENNNSIIKITCRDTSYRFDKINIPRATIADRNLDDLLNTLFSNVPNVTWVYLDDATRTRCEGIAITNSWYYASDLKTLLNKICAVGMLRIYYNNKTFYVGRVI